MDELFWRAISLSYRLSASGLAIGLTSGGLITDIYFKDPKKDEHMNAYLRKRLMNFKLGGSIFATICIGILMNFLSRKCLHKSMIAICLIGGLMAMLAQNYDTLLFAQILIGCSHGGLYVLAPIYSSEMVPRKFRGIQVLSFRLMQAVGFYFGMILTIVKVVNDLETSRLNSTLIMTVLLLPSFFLPESPLLLVQQNKDLEAIKILETLHGPYSCIESELDDLKAQVNGIEPNKIYFISSLNQRGTKVALCTTFYLGFVQQVTEISTTFCLSTIRAATSSGPQRIYLNIIAFLFYMGQIVACISSALAIDMFGRRLLLMTSTILTQIITFCLALRLQFFQTEFLANQSTIDMMFVLVIAISRALGLNTIPMLLTTELYPAEIKWFGMMMITLFPRIRHLLFTGVSVHTEKQRILTVNILFATILISFGVYVLVGCIPETSNRKLHEVHKILNDDKVDVG